LKGIGFNSQTLNKQGESYKNMFVSSESKVEVIMSDNMSKHYVYLQRKTNVPWKCHYCGRNGHIKPYCFELHGYPKQHLPPKPNQVVIKEWKPKVSNTCHIVHKTLKASKTWYFDSGCSRHMNGVKKHLVDIRPYLTSFVILELEVKLRELENWLVQGFLDFIVLCL
jgi:hypothetical protein